MLVPVVVHVHLSCIPPLLAHPCPSHPRPAHSRAHARRMKTRRTNPSTHARRTHAPSRTSPATFRRPALADELLASTPSRLHACTYDDAPSPF
ncbi:hypothetical protein K438DRAFT_1841586 [Mycena galopus ATCC 62051]|nr:hypothetical protein K438DRAFT_1841586 [Mycena galopus ATCC 62051]